MHRNRSPQTKNVVNAQRMSLAYKKNVQLVNNTLNQILFKKLRYTFQVLKQFYLFPQGSSSSVMSLQEYDNLIFSGEKIHTLVKKLETKVLQRKIWGFLNIKMLRILKQVNLMASKITKVYHKKQIHIKNLGFQKIKTKAKEISIQPLVKRKLKDSSSQTKIQAPPSVPSVSYRSRVNQMQRSQILINQTEEISYRREPVLYVHRGSRSRSRSDSPNISYTRVIRQQQIIVIPKQIHRNVIINQQNTRTTQIIYPRSPVKIYPEMNNVKRQYQNNDYRVAPQRVRVLSRVVNCGCQGTRSCQCGTIVSRMCGCSTCGHTCNGCNRCDSCHRHCNCGTDANRSCSRDRKTIKIIKSPFKKNLDDSKSIQNRNYYLNHLESNTSIPANTNYRYEYTQTKVTHIRR